MREMKDSAISLIAIVRYHFFFYLTNFLPLLFQWIADNNIQQQSFRSRNTRQLFNFLFIEPTKDTRTQAFTFGSKNNMGSCNAYINQGEMLVFHFTSQKRSNIGRFLHYQDMYGCILRKLIHTKPGSSLPYFAGKFSVRNHHKLPRLCIAS